MEGSNSHNIPKNSTPTPEAELNPQRVKVLLNKLHEEFNASKIETDPIKVKEHLSKVDKIKRVLKIYHDQQKQRQAIESGNITAASQSQTQQSKVSPGQVVNAQPSSNLAPIAGSPSTSTAVPTQQLPPTNQQQITSDSAVRSSQAPQIQSPAPQRPSSSSPDAQKITIEKYNQVKSVLKDLAEKVQSLTAVKEKETDPARIQALERTLTESRIQLQQYHKGALYMRKVLMDSGRLTANSTPVPSPRPPTATSAGTTAMTAVAADGSASTSQPQASVNERTITNVPTNITTPSQQPISTNQTPPPPAPALTTAAATNKKLPSPATNETKPSTSPSSTKPPTVSKPSTTTKASTSTKKPQASTSSTTVANTTSSATLVNSLKEFSNNSQAVAPVNIPDNGGRVLTKRKLNELVTNLSVDQGDTKPTIDNDVEELFLDLADEFVSSVMGFSCNLAKHRKLDKVDMRDVQLSLERNWGIKVPGYMPDEIKPARRWPKGTEQKK
ncbi:hypothetical protein KGF57_001740 [Candida theae]|uniref:Transcription initiation factor TFIID subunit 12 domain-containing protein n=1 Tax=Candida theae TaxID=1198502 RepID=A0AAD5FZP5_9ASCO|nr:uncharacterized protein KGF57_001740 [Candida theae]KAI5961503.1 hypothetical protein KGF57_001740 [Candida theae]